MITTRICMYESLFTNTAQYMNRVLESIIFSQGLNNWAMIKPLLYINIMHILQTDKPKDEWIFHIQK